MNSNISFKNLRIGYINSAHNSKFPEMTSLNNEGLIILLGRNATGKSTLLRTLAGLQPPLSGELKLKGKNIRQYSQKERSTLISFVSTEKPDISNMSVYNLVSLGRYAYTNWLGSLDGNDETVVNNAMKMTGTQHLANKNISEISDGELQRTMIARSLAQNTPVIILDEPVAYLDLPNKIEILLLLRNLAWNEKKTIILSAHDLDTAIRLADKLWIMTDKSLEQGAPEDLAIERRFDTIFKNTEIQFNYNTGLVDIGTQPSKTISLHCDDTTTAFWLNRAFNRLGYRQSERAEISVEVHNRTFICKTHDGEKHLHTIYELCHEIAAHKEQ